MARRKNRTARQRLAKLRAEFYANPWAMMPHALGLLHQAIEQRDPSDIKAALSLGAKSEDSEIEMVDGVVVIPVTGVLRDEVDYMVRWGEASSYQLIEQAFNQAIANDQVKSVVFFIDSPGGSAVGVKRLADLIYRSRGEKPTVAYTQGVCGSAAYYIATACGRIEATADSLVGSVGTIFPHVEMSEFLKDIGYGVTVITNTDSPKKGHGNYYEPLSDDARSTLQTFVNSYGRPFVEDVARYRGISPDDVVAGYGKGDAMRADVAIDSGMVDSIVENFSQTLASLSESDASPSQQQTTRTPVVTGSLVTKPQKVKAMKVSQKVRAQLFASGLIEKMDADELLCEVALTAWFRGNIPEDESAIIKGLQASASNGDAEDMDDDEASDEDKDEEPSDKTPTTAPSNKTRTEHPEHKEARLDQLQASAKLFNKAHGSDVVTSDMILDAHNAGMGPKDAAAVWASALSAKEPALKTARVTGNGADRYASDAVDALVYRSLENKQADKFFDSMSDGAKSLSDKPLWAVAGKCLEQAGQKFDMYGDRQVIAEAAMRTATPFARETYFSSSEHRRYVSAASGAANRPGDFPNILANLANKYLDMIELDDDYSYPQISALLPGGLNDFKPAPMSNKGIVEELDEISDGEKIKQLGIEEEVLSFIFMRRFANSFGWTPVMIANDDMNAFAEGMIGLAEAWQVTQNRLVLERFTLNEDLLDGSALFANRANTGSGTNPAQNNNDRTSGGVPSDTEWRAMENLYADIGGVGTGRRVRGTLNTILCPTGTPTQEATSHFANLNLVGEGKSADSTANLGLYRGKVTIVPDSELRTTSTTTYYGLRSPTRLNTATIVRGYFNGYGTAGRRERWYDPTDKTTYVSLEGRVAVATKNWRYAVRNAGA